MPPDGGGWLIGLASGAFFLRCGGPTRALLGPGNASFGAIDTARRNLKSQLARSYLQIYFSDASHNTWLFRRLRSLHEDWEFSGVVIPYSDRQ